MKNMTREEISAAVCELVKQVLRVDGEVNESMNFVKDLGADSLDVVELVMAVEEKFGVRVNDDDVMQIRTVQGVVDSLAAL